MKMNAFSGFLFCLSAHLLNVTAPLQSRRPPTVPFWQNEATNEGRIWLLRGCSGPRREALDEVMASLTKQR
jgi:hypothetical protein